VGGFGTRPISQVEHVRHYLGGITALGKAHKCVGGGVGGWVGGWVIAGERWALRQWSDYTDSSGFLWPSLRPCRVGVSTAAQLLYVTSPSDTQTTPTLPISAFARVAACAPTPCRAVGKKVFDFVKISDSLPPALRAQLNVSPPTRAGRQRNQNGFTNQPTHLLTLSAAAECSSQLSQRSAVPLPQEKSPAVV